MSIKAKFRDRVNKILYKEYIPKFKIGDVIYNKKYEVLAKVIGIDNSIELYKIVFPESKMTYEEQGRCYHYIVKEMENGSVKNKSTVGKVNKERTAITTDMFYIKVDEKAAKILYGKNKN